MASDPTDPTEPLPPQEIELPSWLPNRKLTGRRASGRTLQTRGEDMMNRLLDAGREAFWALGYEATRVDDIVERVGASHGTFYLYFRNKEDLLHRLAIGCAEDLRALAAMLEAIERPPQLDQLTAWIDDFVGSYRRNGPVMRVWLERRDLDPLMQALANEVLGRLAEALGSLVDPEADSAIGPGMVRLSLLAMLERFAAYSEASNGGLAREEVVATLAQLLLGLMVPPGDGQPGSDAADPWARDRT